jgi:hypothetical protein
MLIRFLRLAAVFVALVAGTVSPAAAQYRYQQDYRGTIDQQRACRPNVFRFCATEIPNVQRITACLIRNFDRLSPDCAAVFAEEQPMRRR